MIPQDAVVVALGLVVGATLRLYRIGGGAVAKPALRLAGLGAVPTIGSAVPAILALTSGTAIRGWRDLRRHRAFVWWASTVGAVGGVGAALASRALPGEGHWQNALAGAVIAVSAALWRPDQQIRWASGSAKSQSSPHRANAITVGIVVGLLGGLSMGLLGVGGGIFILPLLLSRFRLDPKTATNATAFVVAVTALVVIAAHSALGLIDWRYATMLLVGVMLGEGTARSLRWGVNPAMTQLFGMVLVLVGATFALVELWLLSQAA